VNQTAQKIERLLLGIWPLIYGLLVWPSHSAANVFAQTRVSALAAFLILALVLRMAVHPEISFSQIPQLFRRQPKYVLWMLGFIGALILSVFFSSAPYVALFGTQSLQTGAIFITLSLLTFWLYSSGPAPSRFGLVALFIIINLLTIAEYLGFRPLAPIVEKYITLNSPFPAVTVGLRGHLAGMLVLLSLLPLYWFRDRLNDWRFWTLFILGCVGLGCTSNSSTYVGMAVTLTAFLWFNRHDLKWTVLLVPVVALLSMSAYLPLASLSQSLNAWGWVHIKAESKDLTSSVTLQTRLLLWESAARMGAARPILGWGPQTFNNHWYDYLSKAKGDKLFRLELGLNPSQKMVRINDSIAFKDENGQTQPRHLNYISSHNALLDLFYSQGFVGSILLVIFCASLIKYLHVRMGKTTFYALLPFLAYGIYLLAWFITVPVTGLVCIVLGFLVAELKSMPAGQRETIQTSPSLVSST
jgi:O-antigen ligase